MAIVASSCAAKPQVACNAALARPSLLVDLRAFVAAHHGVNGRLCPWRTGDRADALPCISFSVNDDGTLASTSTFGAAGPSAGLLQIYLTPSDDRLTVHLHAGDLGVVTETAALRGRRGPGPCAGFIYSDVIVTATGALTTS